MVNGEWCPSTSLRVKMVNYSPSPGGCCGIQQTQFPSTRLSQSSTNPIPLHRRGGRAADGVVPRSHAPAWECREKLNTKKKLVQATNPKLTHCGTKIIQNIQDMRSHAGAWEREE